MPTLGDKIDARFGPICDAMDAAVNDLSMTNGEQLMLLTILLVGNLRESPPDVAIEMRRAVAAAILNDDITGLLALCRKGLRI